MYALITAKSTRSQVRTTRQCFSCYRRENNEAVERHTLVSVFIILLLLTKTKLKLIIYLLTSLIFPFNLQTINS